MFGGRTEKVSLNCFFKLSAAEDRWSFINIVRRTTNQAVNIASVINSFSATIVDKKIAENFNFKFSNL